MFNIFGKKEKRIKLSEILDRWVDNEYLFFYDINKKTVKINPLEFQFTNYPYDLDAIDCLGFKISNIAELTPSIERLQYKNGLKIENDKIVYKHPAHFINRYGRLVRSLKKAGFNLKYEKDIREWLIDEVDNNNMQTLLNDKYKNGRGTIINTIFYTLDTIYALGGEIKNKEEIISMIKERHIGGGMYWSRYLNKKSDVPRSRNLTKSPLLLTETYTVIRICELLGVEDVIDRNLLADTLDRYVEITKGLFSTVHPTMFYEYLHGKRDIDNISFWPIENEYSIYIYIYIYAKGNIDKISTKLNVGWEEIKDRFYDSHKNSVSTMIKLYSTLGTLEKYIDFEN